MARIFEGATIFVGIEDGKVEVVICDWVFAGFNYPAGDIAQLEQDLRCNESIGQQLPTPFFCSIKSRLIFTSILYVTAEHLNGPNYPTVLLICI